MEGKLLKMIEEMKVIEKYLRKVREKTHKNLNWKSDVIGKVIENLIIKGLKFKIFRIASNSNL